VNDTFSGSKINYSPVEVTNISLGHYPIPNGANHFAVYTVVNGVESSTPATVAFTDVVAP